MIPRDWQPHHRTSDGELVGYLAPGADGAVPMTLIGTPLIGTALIGTALGSARSRESAAALLDVRGLAVLAERWWCRLPRLLPREGIDASRPELDWDWRAVVIIESSPTECRIRPAMPWPEELASSTTLVPPVGELLLRIQPE